METDNNGSVNDLKQNGKSQERKKKRERSGTETVRNGNGQGRERSGTGTIRNGNGQERELDFQLLRIVLILIGDNLNLEITKDKIFNLSLATLYNNKFI